MKLFKCNMAPDRSGKERYQNAVLPFDSVRQAKAALRSKTILLGIKLHVFLDPEMSDAEGERVLGVTAACDWMVHTSMITGFELTGARYAMACDEDLVPMQQRLFYVRPHDHVKELYKHSIFVDLSEKNLSRVHKLAEQHKDIKCKRVTCRRGEKVDLWQQYDVTGSYNFTLPSRHIAEIENATGEYRRVMDPRTKFANYGGRHGSMR